MRLCPSCQSEISASAIACTACGKPVPRANYGTVRLDTSASRNQGNGETGASTIEIGAVIEDRYRILDRLGSGSMGSVYRAQDLSIGEDVALKFISPQCEIDADCSNLLSEEVRISRHVTHPNVCRVHDIGNYVGRPFISMEYVDGEDLSSLVRRIGRVHGEKAHQIARQLCAGLQAAHERGVLHCDLKPANVMLDGEGNVRIADFGIAAVIGGAGEEGTRGTPAYMAPELFTGAPATVQSDLYSLGLVLYEVYTGERLFDADSMTELLDLHRSMKPAVRKRVRDIDNKVEEIIHDLLDRDPARRPASAMVVLARLPGGDPLAAALASGETPSPELIAGAGGVSRITKRNALIMVVCVLVGWLLVCWLGNDVKLLGRAPLPRSGEVLRGNAIDLIEDLFIDDLFPGDAAADHSRGSGWAFERHDGYLAKLRGQDLDEAGWRTAMEASWPNLVDFWYRSNPRPLAATNVKGRIRWDDPPFVSPGMIRVRLDSRGRLRELQSIPAAVGTLLDPSDRTDADEGNLWDRLFEAAGLDRKSFTSAESAGHLVPLGPTTSTGAWTGSLPGSPSKVHVHASAFHGQPTGFSITGYGVEPGSFLHNPPHDHTWRYYALILLLVVATGMAWFNLSRGRSDRRGATYLGLVTVGLVVVFTLLTGDHNGQIWGFFELINKGMIHGLLVSGQLIVFYLALEPHARRAWPETLISWSRLLAGRFHDSLVGYHVLVGLLVGVGVAVFTLERHFLARLLDSTEGPPIMYSPAGLDALRGPVNAVGTVVELVVDMGRESIKFLMALVVLRLLLRSRRAGAIAAFLLFVWVFSVDSGIGSTTWKILGAFGVTVTVGALTLLLVRFGVVSLMVSLIVSRMLIDFPLSFDPQSWFGGVTLLSFLVLAACAIHAYRCATRHSTWSNHPKA